MPIKRKNKTFEHKKLNPQDFPDKPDHNCPIPATTKNLEYILNEHEIRVRFDLVKKDIEITIPQITPSKDNEAEVKLNTIACICKLNRFKTTDLKKELLAIADKYNFNPIKEWIESKPWDKQDRIREMLATITVNTDICDESFKNTLLTKWLLSATAAVMIEQGFQSRGVLTLQGAQGIGKTSWLRQLMPQTLSQKFIKLDHHLNPRQKDSKISAITHWIVELGEAENSIRSNNLAALKSFITADMDIFRRPYGSVDSTYPRRTVFFASVNQANFLLDKTGNSRWWVLPVVEVNYNHRIDMQQLFAQLAYILKEDEAREDHKKMHTWWLNEKEEKLLEEHNAHFEEINPIEETLKTKLDLDPDSWPNEKSMTATEVLKEVVGIKTPTNAQARECGGVLRKLLGDPKKINGIMKWRVPLK